MNQCVNEMYSASKMASAGQRSNSVSDSAQRQTLFVLCASSLKCKNISRVEGNSRSRTERLKRLKLKLVDTTMKMTTNHSDKEGKLHKNTKKNQTTSLCSSLLNALTRRQQDKATQSASREWDKETEDNCTKTT